MPGDGCFIVCCALLVVRCLFVGCGVSVVFVLLRVVACMPLVARGSLFVGACWLLACCVRLFSRCVVRCVLFVVGLVLCVVCL